MSELRLLFLLRLYMKILPASSSRLFLRLMKPRVFPPPRPACLLDAAMSLTQNRSRVVMACL